MANIKISELPLADPITGVESTVIVQGGVTKRAAASNFVGPQGPKGDTGATGATGPAGPTGPQGPAGADGTSVALKGSVNTVGDLPTGASNGDLYVVLADGNGYVWNGTAWNNVGPIRGPKGDTGETGAQGPQGLKGDTGDTGPQGQQGLTGPAGATGATGPAGADGVNGNSAYQVAVANGFVGTEAQWLASLVGPQGEQGIQGIQGPKGDTGATGPAGTTSWVGITDKPTTIAGFGITDAEPAIAAPGSAPTEKYWRGDKTWRDFFTDVRAATLTGLSTATNAVVAATDTVLAAIGKLQAQVSAKFDKTGGDISGNVNLPSLNGGQLAGLRNKIINGRMEIAQRGATVSLTASGQYSLDRWIHTWDGAGATHAVFRKEFPAGTGPETIRNFLSYAQSVAGSGGTFNALEQRIEGVDNFAGQTVTLSFYARNNAATPLPQIICRQFFGSSGSATVNTTVATNVATTASFTRYTFTFTVPSIVGKTVAGGNDYLSILILLPINSVLTFDITGVQLEVGSVATPFEHRPYGMELALCQRYYYRVQGGAGVVLGWGFNNFNNTSRVAVPFPVPMRTIPSALEQSGVASDYVIQHLGTAAVCANAPTLFGSTSSNMVGSVSFAVSSGLVAGQGSFGISNGANAYLGFSAEL